MMKFLRLLVNNWSEITTLFGTICFLFNSFMKQSVYKKTTSIIHAIRIIMYIILVIFFAFPILTLLIIHLNWLAYWYIIFIAVMYIYIGVDVLTYSLKSNIKSDNFYCINKITKQKYTLQQYKENIFIRYLDGKTHDFKLGVINAKDDSFPFEFMNPEKDKDLWTFHYERKTIPDEKNNKLLKLIEKYNNLNTLKKHY